MVALLVKAIENTAGRARWSEVTLAPGFAEDAAWAAVDILRSELDSD